MKRIASSPFELTLEDGSKKKYALGEPIDEVHIDHWWAEAHSTEVDAEAEAARRAQQEADAEKLQRLEDENAQLKAQLAALQAGSESSAPSATPPDPKKDGGNKKGDKETSSK